MVSCNQPPKRDRAKYMRERRAGRAIRVLQIELCAEDFDLYQRAREKQRGPIAGAARRMLLTGAKFIANSGTPRGKKIKSA
jgi:hypothetical protein